jgi:molybdopterin/thiamine biosynthesis adenylyltransferase
MHGIERALDRASMQAGFTTSLFFVAFDVDDRVVGGLRCHGPLRSVDDAHLLTEFSGSPGLGAIRSRLAAHLNMGILEIKGCWVSVNAVCKRAVSDGLARCYVHAMDLLQARFACCSSAGHAVKRWATSGGRVVDGVPPVAYPDARYQTVMLWWDRKLVDRLSEPSQLERIAVEGRALVEQDIEVVAGDLPLRLGPFSVPPAGSGDPSQALVLDDSVAEDREVLRQLRAQPMVQVLDHLAQQLGELRRLRPRVDSDLLGERPRWVYYPWRRSLVSLLGPRSFRALRLDRNRNKISREEQSVLGRQRIGVVGLSVGHAIAHTLALEGLCGELRLADFDEIELSNLNRVPGTVLDLGLNKATVTARRVAELDPYLSTRVEPAGLAAENVDRFLDGLDILIDECDSLDVKLLVREGARARGIPVIMETSDRGLLDIERFDLERGRPLFHGLLGGVESADLMGLSTKDKVPHVLRILEPRELSARMAASMAEIDETVTTWPQLGSDITLGAASVATAVRRIGTGQDLPSGRIRVDLDTALDAVADPPPSQGPPNEVADGDWALVQERDPLRDVARAASLAPSGGNSQPWMFSVDGQALRIYLDTRRTSAMDVAHRGSYVAIGAALYNARVAAASRGILGTTELFPHGIHSDHVATLRFGEVVDIDLASEYEAMLRRSTNRREGRPAAIDPSLVEQWHRGIELEGARLHVVTDRPTMAECADLLGESDRLRFLTPRLHSEMMSELRWPGRSTEVGLDVRTLELDAADMAKLAVARRADVMANLSEWGGGRALGEVTRERVRSSSALAVVTVARSDAASFVRGGSAVERFWISAERAGLAVQPVSPVFIYGIGTEDYAALVGERRVVELEELALRFRSQLGISQEHLALVMRISHAPKPTCRSRRLTLEALLRRVDLAAEPADAAVAAQRSDACGCVGAPYTWYQSP